MIFLCPGSARSQIFKRWPVEKFFELGVSLKEKEYKVGIVLGKEEKELVDLFVGFDVYFDYTLSKLSNLVSSDDLCICNDSFLMHFFSAKEIKTLAIYGPTDPSRTLPVDAFMVRSAISSETRPCWGTIKYGECDNGRCSCLDGLEVNNLLRAIFKILKEN